MIDALSAQRFLAEWTPHESFFLEFKGNKGQKKRDTLAMQGADTD